MIGYASRTGTRRNLAALRDAGWRLIVSARGVLRNEGFQYALDNGAWTAFQAGEAFDVSAFEKAVTLLGYGADWIVAPDIVGGGVASLEMSLPWIDILSPIAPVLIAVQDGMVAADVAGLIGSRVGIFVGGSTAWKLATMNDWGALGRLHGAWVHVGRVNSARRIWQARDAGAHSFDGTSASRYACTLPALDRARRQEGFKWQD